MDTSKLRTDLQQKQMLKAAVHDQLATHIIHIDDDDAHENEGVSEDDASSTTRSSIHSDTSTPPRVAASRHTIQLVAAPIISTRRHKRKRLCGMFGDMLTKAIESLADNDPLLQDIRSLVRPVHVDAACQTDVSEVPAKKQRTTPSRSSDEDVDRVCMVCMARPPSTIVHPCKCCVVCSTCSRQLEEHQNAEVRTLCMRCRRSIERIEYCA